jgi:hypothetical protein
VINGEKLCVEFCNFVQYNILLNCLTFAVNEINIKYNEIATYRNKTVSGCTNAIEIYYTRVSQMKTVKIFFKYNLSNESGTQIYHFST